MSEHDDLERLLSDFEKFIEVAESGGDIGMSARDEDLAKGYSDMADALFDSVVAASGDDALRMLLYTCVIYAKRCFEYCAAHSDSIDEYVSFVSTLSTNLKFVSILASSDLVPDE